MTLKEYIRYKQSENDRFSFSESLFSEHGKGEFVHQWAAAVQSIEFFTRFRGITDFGGRSTIKITVRTSVPCIKEDEDPFFWNGPINEYPAEAAVMRAYELLTPGELEEFIRVYKPEVTFSFFENNHPALLIVVNSGMGWEVADNPFSG